MIETIIEIVGGFFVVLGWTVIFYFFFRKKRKPWFVLVSLSTGLSYFTLLFFASPKSSVLDPFFLNKIGLLIGSFFVSIFFLFKSHWLAARPSTKSKEEDVYKKNKRLRLRHILELGILLEEEGRAFYEAFAAATHDQRLKHLCQQLAQDEKAHKILIEGVLHRWLPLSMGSDVAKEARDDLRKRGIFLNPPSLDNSMEDMFNYALDQEREMIDFYSSLESNFPESWKRLHVQRLVMEEKKHVLDIEALRSQLVR